LNAAMAADRQQRNVSGISSQQPGGVIAACERRWRNRIERFRLIFAASRVLPRLVSQAGYNTLMEILAVGARAVVVPFADGQESEQPLRARLLAERGLVQAVAPEELTPALLAAAIDAAAAMPVPPEGLFNLKGAAATAEILHQAPAAAGRMSAWRL
jgi:predicted glycosyltransferase